MMSITGMIIKGYTLLFRFFIVLLLGMPLIIPFVPKDGLAQSIALRHNVVVQDHTIKLGDLFYGLDSREEHVLGAAPPPGEQMTLSARTLLRVAMAMDLPWRPASTADYVVIHRAATVIERDTIEKALLAALKDKGLKGEYKLNLPYNASQIVLPDDQPARVEIGALRVKHDRQWFEATLFAPSLSNPIETLQVAGSFSRLVDVPVLKNTVRRGDLIGQADIDTIRVEERNITAGTIINPKNLVNMTPKTVITPGDLIELSDIEQPLVINRGDLVTMIYRKGQLLLTAQGKALQNGAVGDIVRISNMGSSKTVEGRVSGEREVVIEQF